MATITNQTTSGNSITFNVKEGLYYPFSLGDWSELRLSVFLSCTNSSSTNAQYTDDSQQANAAQNGFYFGLIGSGGINSLPYSAPVNFIGIGINTGVSSFAPSVQLNTSVGLIWDGGNVKGFTTIASGCQTSETSIPGSNNANFDPIYISTPTLATGTEQFADFFSVKFTVNNKNTPLQNFNLQTSSTHDTYTKNVSIENLQALTANFPNASPTLTGFRYNAQCALTGTPLPLPNTVFIFFPLSHNRLRLHNLSVDKYA